MNDLIFDLHKYPYDGERISPYTFYSAQPNKAKIHPRFANLVRQGDERNLTATQQVYLVDCIAGKRIGSKSSHKIIVFILAVFFIFHISKVFYDSLPDNPTAALLLSILFLATATGIIIFFYHYDKNREDMLVDAINKGHYKVYAYNIDNKMWNVCRGDDDTEYHFYLYANGIYFSVNSELYLTTRIGEPLFGAIISTEKGDYLYLVPGVLV